MLKNVLKIIPWCALFWAGNANAAINVAVIAPQVGEFKHFGNELINGVRIAVDDINSQGGVKGERVNLVVVDDQCDDTFAVSTAQMMAVNSSKEDRMNLVVGPYCPNAFEKVSDIYAKANIFQIIPTTISKSEAQHSHQGLVKMVGSTDSQGADFYNYYKASFNGQNVALIYDSSVRNVVEIAASVQNEFRRNNAALKLRVYDFAVYRRDLAAMAQDITVQGNDVVYILGKSENIAELSRNLKDEKKDVVIFTNRYQANGNYEELLGDLAEGSYFVALPSLKDKPSFTETLVRLRLQGAEPEGLGVYSYSAVKLWQELVDKADSFKYGDLAKALGKDKVETVWGERTFVNGNPDKSINYGIYKLEGGEYTQVY